MAGGKKDLDSSVGSEHVQKKNSLSARPTPFSGHMDGTHLVSRRLVVCFGQNAWHSSSGEVGGSE